MGWMMKTRRMNYYTPLLCVLLIGVLSAEARAKDGTQPAIRANDTGAAEVQANEFRGQDTPAKEGMQAEMKADKTGTNPINFTYDLRVYNEHQWLNVPGDGDQNITTLEFRAPFADGKWQFRTRVRATYLDIDRAGIDEFGFGDMDIRFLTVPYMNMEKKMAIATGLEIFINTASDTALGSNAFSLGPQIFGVFFKPFGGFFDLIAPAYQHKFSVYEESGASDVHQGLIDIFFLKTSADRQKWFLLDPQIILDYENSKEFVLFDAEAGMMMDNLLGTKGHSAYVRPSFGIGHYRPYDFSLEIGYKIVW
jgi:hypothetical protein